MTDGDGDTALDEAELGVHLVERGCADYILAPGDTFLASSGKKLTVISADEGLRKTP